MPRPTANDDAWLLRIEKNVKAFCVEYRVAYACKQRERAASFEIGCLHMILKNYEKAGMLEPQNLNAQGEFRYLTSPNGDPANFSWIRLTLDGKAFQIRQQVRIKSHWNENIAFCPDIVVLKADASIDSERDEDFANGKRAFYSVKSSSVVSAHECKSLNPFPELLVSFVGLFQAAHSWFDPSRKDGYAKPKGMHLAPCLFIGGDSRPFQMKMIRALETVFPINIVCGLHSGRFRMNRTTGNAKYIDCDEDPKPLNSRPGTGGRRVRLLDLSVSNDVPF